MKKNCKKNLLIGLAVIASPFLLPAKQTFSGDTQQKKQEEYSISDFITQFRFEKHSSFQNAILLRTKEDDAYLKITELNAISLEHAKSDFSDKMFSIQSLYREANSPYPGALSNKITCPDEFKPKKVERATFDYYLVYANNRFNYGACLWDLIQYRAVIYPLYCSQDQRLYQLELFIPKNSDLSIYQSAIENISCE